VLASSFHIHKCRPLLRWNRPPRKLDRNHGSHALGERHQPGAQRLVVLQFGIVNLFQIGSHRRDQAVRQKNAQKRPYQSRCDLSPDLFRGPPKDPMVITTPSTAATIPKPGNASATMASERTGAETS
jgi:hypothetical protein